MATISIKVDDDLKRDVEREFKAMGLSMSAGISIYLNRVRQEHKVPFELENSRQVSRKVPVSLMKRIRSNANIVKFGYNEKTGASVLPKDAPRSFVDWVEHG